MVGAIHHAEDAVEGAISTATGAVMQGAAGLLHDVEHALSDNRHAVGPSEPVRFSKRQWRELAVLACTQDGRALEFVGSKLQVQSRPTAAIPMANPLPQL